MDTRLRAAVAAEEALTQMPRRCSLRHLDAVSTSERQVYRVICDAGIDHGTLTVSLEGRDVRVTRSPTLTGA